MRRGDEPASNLVQICARFPQAKAKSDLGDREDNFCRETFPWTPLISRREITISLYFVCETNSWGILGGELSPSFLPAEEYSKPNGRSFH